MPGAGHWQYWLLGNVCFQAEFGNWDRVTQNHMIGALSYGYLFTQILGGWVTDKFGGRYVLLVGMTLLSMSNFFFPAFAR